MIAHDIGNTETAQIELSKAQSGGLKKKSKNLRYIEQACLLSNNRIKFVILKDDETKKILVDLRHLNKNKLTKRGVRLGLSEFREVLGIPRLSELLDFYSNAE